MTGKLTDETHFNGLPISPGVALARVCLLRQVNHENVPDYRVAGEGVEQERARLKQAVAAVAEHLEGLKATVAERLGQAEAEIFAVQRLILEDPALDGQLMEAIDDGYNCESAILRTFEQHEARLRQLDSDYHAERASDLGEVKRRLLDHLCGTKPTFQCGNIPECQRGRQRIIITEELTPSLTLELETDEILGIVTERGGATSHAAILARAMGIPAVSGIPHIHDLVACGTETIVNGDTGEVTIWPSEEVVKRIGPTVHVEPRAVPDPVEALRVMANINLAGEVKAVRRMKAEGIGLYRTEMEFFAAGRLLDENEQAERYTDVLKAVDSQPVYFRLLDLGGDKPSPLFEFPAEGNPSLGLRGARYLLSHPDLLRTQARALARASRYGTVHVMYPMIVGVDQFRRTRDLFEEATADTERGEIRHGPMFEVPSAVLEANELLAEADFASIGSNDLVQYLFVVDRNNEHVAGDYSPDRPVFWRVLEDLVRAAEEVECPLAICGEMASDPAYIERLLSLGIRTVSVSPRLSPGVRQAVKETSG